MEEEDLPDTDDLCSISLIKRPEWISINLKIVKKKEHKDLFSYRRLEKLKILF